MNDEMVTEKLNLSLTKEQKDKLTTLAKKEDRKYSQQVVHMMEFYLQKKPIKLHELFDKKDKGK